MKVAIKDNLIFSLEPENEVDQVLIDALDMYGRNALMVEEIKRAPSPDVRGALCNASCTLNLDPENKQVLADKSARQCINALRQLARLALADGAGLPVLTPK